MDELMAWFEAYKATKIKNPPQTNKTPILYAFLSVDNLKERLNNGNLFHLPSQSEKY